MTTILNADSKSPPLAAIVMAKMSGTEIRWGSSTSVDIGGVTFTGSVSTARLLARNAGLYGSDPISSTEVDHWVQQASTIASLNSSELAAFVKALNKSLALRTYLVENTATLADAIIFSALASTATFGDLSSAPNVARWYGFVSQIPAFKEVAVVLSSSKAESKADVTPKTDGKFFALTNAVQGEVITRFPPEASGYLHIGHAKAALINEHLAKQYNGKMIMRFDDTNPAKEDAEFEKVILEDLELLNVKPDRFTYTSDSFELIQTKADELVAKGEAFCDTTPSEEMKEIRGNRKPSAFRDATVAENQKLWDEMKAGTALGRTCCLRIKIDYASENGALRDPTIYRCKPEVHPRTGDKFKVYPTYDFACPIVDSCEGVTHALRTTEYHDRNPQYEYICKAVGLRVPYVEDFSRLALVNTCMSKRQLTWFIDNKKVESWSDPRFPTVRGILRHGMTLQGLKEFIIGMGSSKTNAMMEWDKIWAINRQVIDPLAPRHTALLSIGLVPVSIAGCAVEPTSVAFHPKNPDVGEKKVWTSDLIKIEAADAMGLVVGEKITLMELGNAVVTGINREFGLVTSVSADFKPDDRDYKGTKKMTWLADCPEEKQVPVICIEFGDLITVKYVPKEDGIEGLARSVNNDSKRTFDLIGASSLASVQQGDIIQINRRGFWVVDQAPHTDLNQPAVLIQIPDGKKNPGSLQDVYRVCGLEVSDSRILDAEDMVDRLKASTLTLKTGKADKDDVKSAKAKLDAAMMKLSSLRAFANFRSDGITAVAPVASVVAGTSNSGVSAAGTAILAKVTAAGDVVRELKAAKASKDDIMAAVAKLNGLKAEYKAETGEDVPAPDKRSSKTDKKAAKAADPVVSVTAIPSTRGDNDAESELYGAMTAAGEVVRALKAAKAPKAEIDVAVATLLAAKAEYTQKTGKEAKTGGGKEGRARQEKLTPEQKEAAAAKRAFEKKAKAEKAAKKAADASGAKLSKLGLSTAKADNLSDWYTDVITKAQLIEYYDVSGCYILRPGAYSIWEFIQKFFDSEIKKLGVQNAYFPMFVSKAALEKEKDHIEDFAPEVAWVTKSGESDLAMPIAVRPTSETVMYPAYANWIQSHRDLPLKLNQWCNVVRWEFKQPQPFLRTREFLWQEGHTAFTTPEEAGVEVLQILELYSRVYQDLLALPVVKGRKTEKEKFAGGDYTTTVEAFIPAAGRAIQGATSHHLGQNFSKMFNIVYEDPEKPGMAKKHVYQNSWGLTTRTIGVMIMVHGDDRGIVLPPRVASIQVMIVPVGLKAGQSHDDLFTKCSEVKDVLNALGIRTQTDTREQYSPGWKFNHWELKGIPLRMEIGPRDIAAASTTCVRRDTGEKLVIPQVGIGPALAALLEKIQADMFLSAKAKADAGIVSVNDWSDFTPALNDKKLLLVPFCGSKECESKIKEDSSAAAGPVGETDETTPSMGAKSLCIPFEHQREMRADEKCIHPNCCLSAVCICMFGRSY